MQALSVNDIIRAFKEKGLSATFQRIAIYKIMMARKDHPTAEDIYREVLKEHPTMSLATVYKNLEIMATHNLVSKVTYLHDLARYDKDTAVHHHLVCTKCKRIVDIYSKELDELQLPENLKSGFTITNHRVQFDGLCRDCQKVIDT